jgi:hypothetical protein
MTDVTLLQAAPHDRLGSVLGYGVSAALVGRLAQSPRLQARMTELISLRLGDLNDLNREHAKVLAMAPDELTDLSIRAGVVWHAGVIARIIDGVSRRALVVLLGEKNYGLALAGLCSQPPLPDSAFDRGPEDIAKAVSVDGAACLAAWCESQPRAVSGRLRLIRPAASPEDAHETWGPQIVTRLLAD